MAMRIPILFVLLAVGLAACVARRTDVYLWPPAVDVADP
jgi:hypothetical protein